ncbi:MAG: T9SS type A sorting domain-containing protein [Bacteroidaceae bacterium]|nr:T9SS type A sorting domain-containing protein [Bacteroidaceae bacterium]
MRRFLTIVISIFLALPAISQDARTNLIIKTNAGEQTVQFDDLRRITFNATTVQIEKFDGSTISNDMANIIYLSATSNTTNILAPQTSGNLVEHISSDAIVVNCVSGAIVEIYNMSGSRIATRRLDADNGTISIATLPKGIYILRAEGRTVKFLKR